MSYRILIIDDEPDFLASLQTLFTDEGYECVTAANGTVGLRLALSERVDLVITDLKMPGMDGIQVLEAIRREDTGLPVILLTAHGSVDTAVRALKFGAVDYLPKPFDFEILEARIREILRGVEVNRELRILKQQCMSGTCAECTVAVGESIPWKRVLRQVDQASRGDAPVLILGESGTGKDVAARLIHRLSPRVEHPFVAVNAGAIPDHLVEAELFGVRRGAFTGATEDRDGLIRTAGRGTLFLDEVAELPPATQVKLLHVLDGAEARAVGSDESYRAGCRFLAATNQDLKRLLEEGRFREDLYYRLTVFEIAIPPLRERPEDVALLAAHFLRCHAKRLGQPLRTLSPETLTVLSSARWPGNVRQLENVVRRTLMVTGDSRIRPDHLPPDLQPGPGPDLGPDTPGGACVGLKDAVRGFERNYVACALEEANGDRSLAAERLGISRASLYEKVKRFGL
ncbi:MAG: sigma-54 dependent transcriptional regulator [Planctomycetota bacterium]